LNILRLLGRARQPLGLNAIAREVGVISSTCLHILRALEQEGFVAMSPEDKRYTLGLSLVTLGYSALDRRSFPHTVMPHLSKIARDFRATTSALELDNSGRSFVVVAVASAVGHFGVQVEIGRHIPAFLSATGRCFAAHCGATVASLREAFRPLRWADPISFERWIEQVDETRRLGIGADRGNYMRGFHVLTAPVFENGRMTRAVTSIFAQTQLNAMEIKKLSNALRDIAEAMSTHPEAAMTE
jgi:DNA-binding IclR family transcriptional regulator